MRGGLHSNVEGRYHTFFGVLRGVSLGEPMVREDIAIRAVHAGSVLTFSPWEVERRERCSRTARPRKSRPRRYSKDCGLEGWQDCEAALRGMFSTTKQTDATSSPDRVAKVQAVFEIAHNLDMMRCTYEMNERFAEIKKSLK